MSETNVLYKGNYLNLVERDGWEFVTRNHKDVVVILPILENRRRKYGTEIVLINEYRRPLDKKVLSLPAGLVGDNEYNEGIYEATIRELEEETGYRARTVTLALKDCPSSSGMTNETFNLMIAKDLEKVSEGGGDESEDIEIILVDLDQFNEFIKNKRNEGCVIDPKIFMALWFWENEIL